MRFSSQTRFIKELLLCSAAQRPIEALWSALKEVYFRLLVTLGRSGAGDELDCCGCFSVSTRDTTMLVSLVAVSPIFVSLADDKELKLLKYLRRAMSILTPSAACELQRYTWIKYGQGTS